MTMKKAAPWILLGLGVALATGAIAWPRWAGADPFPRSTRSTPPDPSPDDEDDYEP